MSDKRLSVWLPETTELLDLKPSSRASYGSLTRFLANGRMDAKIRAAVSEVVLDEHLDPRMREQVARNMVRRDEH
ncbi:hypothetical protein FE634_08320 [Nocardioides dongxiaopingii]|uniref:hypothetical protein n=1 Tax=Nocardioides TaxID=1839 RepID=UPI0010C76746|nr:MULTISPECIES: hypothetical protein [Nocardioides]QCW50410.1 hypothetical protein FE634_08320 [Nocardioides sp. S-1144]